MSEQLEIPLGGDSGGLCEPMGRSRAAYFAAYRAANREKLLAQAAAYREANTEKILARQKAFREANRERISAKRKAFRKANLQTEIARDKRYYEANKEALCAKQKEYREANCQIIKARKRMYYEANKEKTLSKTKQYRKANREKLRMRDRERYKAKRKITPGIIYAFTGKNIIKLGKVTTGTVEKRLKQVRNGDPSAEYLTSLPVTDVYAEKELHHKFEDRCNGLEWFNITPEEAIAAIQEVAQKYNAAV